MLKFGLKEVGNSWRSTCKLLIGSNRCHLSSNSRKWSDNSFAVVPKAQIDVKAIRVNPDRHSRNCIDRNYTELAQYSYLINESHARWLENERAFRDTRRKIKALEAQVPNADGESKDQLLQELYKARDSIEPIERVQKALQEEIGSLAEALPNLMRSVVPNSGEPHLLKLVERYPTDNDPRRDHRRIGTYLNIIDFNAGVTATGSGYYFLCNDGAKLEKALVNYAESVAQRYRFRLRIPTSMVYSDIGRACGFRPRDQHGEQQVYKIEQNLQDSKPRGPSHSLAGTAEILFAGSRANTVMDHASLPARLVGSSRCHRAEAGSSGRQSQGLYRVHEFTKVEMFTWTMPGKEEQEFKMMVAVQEEIIDSLNLSYRILEMPSQDLGASASRKQDIEVYFPSRRDLNKGWGEVTSTSICDDYQTRRLNTKVRMPPGSQPSLAFPSTVNGTAMAIPRVLAAIIENGWRESDEVDIPEVLWPYMGGQKVIGKQEE